MNRLRIWTVTALLSGALLVQVDAKEYTDLLSFSDPPAFGPLLGGPGEPTTGIFFSAAGSQGGDGIVVNGAIKNGDFIFAGIATSQNWGALTLSGNYFSLFMVTAAPNPDASMSLEFFDSANETIDVWSGFSGASAVTGYVDFNTISVPGTGNYSDVRKIQITWGNAEPEAIDATISKLAVASALTPTPTPTPAPTLTPTPTPTATPTSTPTPTPTPTPSPRPIVVPPALFEGLLGTGQTGQTGATFRENNGHISIKTTTKNTFTGSLRLGADRISLRGEFVSGVAKIENLLRKSGGASLTLIVRARTGVPLKIEGSVIVSDTRKQLPFVALPPSPYAKKTYSLAMVATGGNGYGFASVTTDANGKIRILGKLPDGSKVIATTVISDGQADGADSRMIAPIYIPQVNGQSLLTGELHIDKIEPIQGPSVGDGGQSWGWARTDVVPFSIKGRSFTVSRGQSLLTASGVSGSFQVVGATNSPLSGTWTAANTAIFADRNYRLTFASKTGWIKGSITNPRISYEGIMFSQALELVAGAQAVHGAGFRLNKSGGSLPVTVTAP